MIKEVLQFISTLKRPELLETVNGQYLLNPAKKCYERVPAHRPFNRVVCNVDSFAKAVHEDVKRNPNIPEDKGFNRTVIFEKSGALFYTDDGMGAEQDVWKFEREFTQLWKVVSHLATGNKLSHRQLLDALESVKIYIPGFENLYQTISKLRASKKINFVSNPIFEDGEQAGSYQWEQKIDSNGATERAVCPSEIPFRGKIVRGSEIEYEFALSLTPVLDDEKGQILFSLSMPGFDMVLDQVREDEYNAFCTLIKPLSELLILRNY
ncbi:hypothetical protein MASR1M12_18990 [Erysipelotrichia bacterium]